MATHYRERQYQYLDLLIHQTGVHLSRLQNRHHATEDEVEAGRTVLSSIKEDARRDYEKPDGDLWPLVLRVRGLQTSVLDQIERCKVHNLTSNDSNAEASTNQLEASSADAHNLYLMSSPVSQKESRCSEGEPQQPLTSSAEITDVYPARSPGYQHTTPRPREDLTHWEIRRRNYLDNALTRHLEWLQPLRKLIIKDDEQGRCRTMSLSNRVQIESEIWAHEQAILKIDEELSELEGVEFEYF
jgi:hypothetical protein